MKIKEITNKVLHNDKTGGILLIITTLASLLIANSQWNTPYISFWQTKVIGLSLEHWINDGLMAIFFLLIGLELEREIYIGELSSKKKAILPFFAALGGMLVPAGIFLIFNNGTNFQSGAGIPMATDIAFALGILSLFG
ncbi:MAG: Na+/H+ antiporter NhaA, partial [Breznakibacter sp.]|nr:Na+/H+ antiporter NhaA [Breznakibacter sp.]